MLEYINLEVNELVIGNLPISDLVERHGTPLYVYDGEIMRRKYRLVRDYFPRFDVFYSMKANPNFSILSYFNLLGAGAEIASAGELHLAVKAGFRRDDIIFVGPGKTEAELKYAIKHGIFAIVVESLNELRRLEKLCAKSNVETNVLLRINIRSWKGCSPEVMAGGPSKLGIDEEIVLEQFQRIRLRKTKIIGIHVYSASQVLDAASISNTIIKTLDLACDFSYKLDFDLKCIDFGGGWGIPYEERDKELDLCLLKGMVSHSINTKLSTSDLKKARLIFELGRYLVAESGVYITRVLDIKESRGRKYLIVEGGMNQLVRPVFMDLNHPTLIVNKLNKNKEETVEIAGQLCTPFDLLGKEVQLPKAQIGDLIGVFNSGAYGFSMSMLNFLSHPWPAEVLVVRDRAYLVRERGTFENLIGNQTFTKPTLKQG